MTFQNSQVRSYVSLIGSGEGRHTTHLPEMRSVTLNFADWLDVLSGISFENSFLHFFWHIFWHSFWHIFWRSFWHFFWQIFWHSSDISFDNLTYLPIFFLTYLPIFFLTYLLTFFLTYLLTYLLTCFLTYLLTFFLTYQRQNIASTGSHKSHSTNAIFTSRHAAKVVSMTTLCLSNGNSTVAFDCTGSSSCSPLHLEQTSLHMPHTTCFPPQPLARWHYNPQHA